jgi:hypothetical protein
VKWRKNGRKDGRKGGRKEVKWWKTRRKWW